MRDSDITIESKLASAVDDVMMTRIGISPEQFTITFMGVRLCALEGDILVLTIVIGDISIFNPGEIGELVTRFR